MIYTCNNCLFTFERSGKVKDCPDCGKSSIREATEKEKDEYEKNQAEYGNIKKKEHNPKRKS